MNKVTVCFLSTVWMLTVPVNQRQDVSTNKCIVKHEEDLLLETAFLVATCVFVNAEIKRDDQTDLIKKENV